MSADGADLDCASFIGISFVAETGADSFQLGLGVGVDLIKVLGDFEPLVMDNLDLVDEQGSQFFCVKALPTTRIGILHFDLPGHWPCAYHKTADSKYVPKTQFIPALNAERKHGFTTPTTLDIVFDQKKEWKKLESTKGGRFLI